MDGGRRGEGEGQRIALEIDKGIITLLFTETLLVFFDMTLWGRWGEENTKVRCETKIKLIHSELSCCTLLEFSS